MFESRRGHSDVGSSTGAFSTSLATRHGNDGGSFDGKTIGPRTGTSVVWYRDTRRLAGAATLGVLLLGVVGWLVVSSGKRKEEFAARRLNQARTTAEAGNLPLASSELQRLIDTYQGTDAATEAVITLNQVRMVNGQSELAAVGLRDFLAKKPAKKYLAPAYALLGTALENSKRPAEAAEAFANASKSADLDYTAGEVPDRCRASLPGRRQDGRSSRGLPGDHPEASQELELH